MSETDAKDKEFPSSSGSKLQADVPQPHEMTTKEAYFASLSAWVQNANHSHNAMTLFPWYLRMCYPQLFKNQPMGASDGSDQPLLSNQQMPNTGANGNASARRAEEFRTFRVLDEQAQTELINRQGGYEYVISHFAKRAAAEVIDVILLLLFKVIVTFMIINIFDLELGFELDKEVFRKAIDDEDITSFLAVSMDFLAFSSDLLLLEVLTKVIVCFYEAAWTAWYGGATPGKAIMNIKILYVEAVQPLQPPQLAQVGFDQRRTQMRALIYPAATPTFRRAFMRAVAKNLVITLLFPMCFIIIFFKNNRTVYDIISKTIVVDHNPNSVLRRPR